MTSNLPRSRLSAILGIIGMVSAASGCLTCGLGYLLALPLGVIGFMMGRSVLVAEDPDDGIETAAEAWARVGTWTGGLSAVFTAVVGAVALLWLISWSLGIGGLAATI